MKSQTATRHDPRYVPSTDPRAVLRAWAGESGHVTMDMGGWTDHDRSAFETAIRDELRDADAKREAAAPSVVVIEPCRPRSRTHSDAD